MNFNDIKNTILQHAEQYSGAAKILFTVESLIEEQQIIERLTYPVFMDLTIDFIEKKFQQLKFANLDSLLIDLRFCQRIFGETNFCQTIGRPPCDCVEVAR